MQRQFLILSAVATLLLCVSLASAQTSSSSSPAYTYGSSSSLPDDIADRNSKNNIKITNSYFADMSPSEYFKIVKTTWVSKAYSYGFSGTIIASVAFVGMCALWVVVVGGAVIIWYRFGRYLVIDQQPTTFKRAFWDAREWQEV